MPIRRILRAKGSEVVTVKMFAKVGYIANLLAERRIGVVLVVDEASELVGILSERDLVHGMARRGASVLDMTARNLMTGVRSAASYSTSLLDAMRIMTEQHIRHLPVIESGKLVGLVSIGDIVKARLDEQEDEAHSMRTYIAGQH